MSTFLWSACPLGSKSKELATGARLSAQVSDGGFAKYSITSEKLGAYVSYRRRRLELERRVTDGQQSTFVERQAEAEEAARMEMNLSLEDVRALQQIVDAVIGKRVLWSRLRASGDGGSESLAPERERYGSSNVDRVLEREAELAQLWQETIAQMGLSEGFLNKR